MEEKQLVSEYSETLDLRQSLFNIRCRTAAFRPAISRQPFPGANRRSRPEIPLLRRRRWKLRGKGLPTKLTNCDVARRGPGSGGHAASL